MFVLFHLFGGRSVSESKAYYFDTLARANVLAAHGVDESGRRPGGIYSKKIMQAEAFTSAQRGMSFAY